MKQEVIIGRVASAIPSLVKQRQPEKILLVTGHHLDIDASFPDLLNALNFPLQIVHPPDGLLQVNNLPKFEDVQIVIAIGGGKVIDFAKGIVHQSATKPHFIVAPTTAGSGSEATPFAVLYNGTEKVSLEHPDFLPQSVVLDALQVNQLPAKQKAISGADAFAQCIEALWNRNANADSDALALKGLQGLHGLLPRFVQSIEEALALQVLKAANLSGQAISITRTTGAHALSYYLTAHHYVPHGQAVALFLPLFFIYNDKPQAEEKLQKIYDALDVSDAREAAETCRYFFSSIGLATNFAEAGLNGVSISELLRSVNQQRFANNPVAFEGAELETLIRRYLC